MEKKVVGVERVRRGLALTRNEYERVGEMVVVHVEGWRRLPSPSSSHPQKDTLLMRFAEQLDELYIALLVERWRAVVGAVHVERTPMGEVYVRVEGRHLERTVCKWRAQVYAERP